MDGQGNESSALFHHGLRRRLLMMLRGHLFPGCHGLRKSQQENSDGASASSLERLGLFPARRCLKIEGPWG